MPRVFQEGVWGTPVLALSFSQVWNGHFKCRDAGHYSLTVCVNPNVAALCNGRSRIEEMVTIVTELLAWPDGRMLSNHSIPFHGRDFAPIIRDNPFAGPNRHGLLRLIVDADEINKAERSIVRGLSVRLVNHTIDSD
jgi:hypothetical protein